MEEEEEDANQHRSFVLIGSSAFVFIALIGFGLDHDFALPFRPPFRCAISRQREWK